jgi:hypothetical protein
VFPQAFLDELHDALPEDGAVELFGPAAGSPGVKVAVVEA